MTQLEILKYAYVGALETCESFRRSIIGKKETREKLLADADRDFEEIRDLMFAEISKETGIDFEETEPEQDNGPANFKVFMQAGSVKCDWVRGLTEQEAEYVCENNGWTYTDENNFLWSLDYEPEGG